MLSQSHNVNISMYNPFVMVRRIAVAMRKKAHSHCAFSSDCDCDLFFL